MGIRNTRPISWIKAARKSFTTFPVEARNAIYDALTVAAEGGKSDMAKPMKGLGAGVFEVAVRHRTDAYRTVYALNLEDSVWVVHAFQKKATQGAKTPQKEIDVIRQRLKRLKEELQR